MHLLITRPIEDATPLAKTLREKGHLVTIEPLIEIRNLPITSIPNFKFQAVIGTSANSFRSISHHPEIKKLFELQTFCVGPSSEKIAQELGFKKVKSSRGGLIELKKLIIENVHDKKAPLLYISGSVTSGEMNIPGYIIKRLIAYDALAIPSLSKDTIEKINEDQICGVYLFSPRTAKIWIELLKKANMLCRAKKIMHYCLSDNTARQLPVFLPRIISIAPENSEMLKISIGKCSDD